MMIMNGSITIMTCGLERLAPHAPVEQYKHNGYEDNADAHLKRQIMGREVVVAVTEGKLHLGPWDRYFMASLMDGEKNVYS